VNTTESTSALIHKLAYLRATHRKNDKVKLEALLEESRKAADDIAKDLDAILVRKSNASRPAPERMRASKKATANRTSSRMSRTPADARRTAKTPAPTATISPPAEAGAASSKEWQSTSAAR
jgi:hypothetical protein